MTHDELKAAFENGAWIFGIEHDGRLHRIENPEWACPADRYLAVVPYVAAPTAAADVPSAMMSAREVEDDGAAG